MRLTDYCAKRPDRKKVIAEACDVTIPAVTHWCNGTRCADPKYWRAIESASEGDVTIADMLADAEQGNPANSPQAKAAA